MEGKELIEALRHATEAMDRAAKTNYLLFMATQKAMASRTPTATVLGSYGFNGSGSTTQLAQWRQIVPRNPRRKRIRFSALNQTLFFANSDNQIDVGSLVTILNNGQNGSLNISANTLVPGYDMALETTESIWILSIVLTGSTWSDIEQKATINYAEEIYSDISAEPFSNPSTFDEPGTVQRLTPGLMSLDGDVRAEYNREGVR